MVHAVGTYLGGIRTVEDLRLRSCVDECTGCWHWRGATDRYGRPSFWAVINGERRSFLGRRGALVVSGVNVPAKHIAFRTNNCDSQDCVNPAHARHSTRANHGQHLAASGRLKTPTKAITAARNRRNASKLTWDMVRDIRSSSEPLRVVAERHGIGTSTASRIRRGECWMDRSLSGASVFSFRPDLLKAA